MAREMIFADVKWWDAALVTVKCPVCDKLHTHGFGASYETTSRAAHCVRSHETPCLTYHFRYPFSQGSGATAYEIDKLNKRYVTLGADPPPKPDQNTLADDFARLGLEEASSANDSRSRLSWAQATEETTLDLTDEVFRKLHNVFGGDETLTMKRLDHVKSRMLLAGDTEYLQLFLDSSPDAEIFLHGRSETGDTTLILAACEKYPSVVELLLENGADPNASNRAGRTPLMEAALWGRCDNVQCLLAAGTDPESEDRAGLKARDFTQLCKRNIEERYHRGGGRAQVYKEDILVANEAREVIKCWLGNDRGDVDPVTTEDDFQHHFFMKSSPYHLKLLSPVEEYKLSSPWKTIGRLERGGSFPPISAMSGWTHSEDVTLVSGKDWTYDVMTLARLIGYTFTPNIKKDQGTQGRYHASHAEPQLIAYFVNKHCFLSEEIRPHRPSINVAQQHFDSLQHLKDGFRVAEGQSQGCLRKLASVRPPVMMKQAIILLSKAPCGECAAFQAAVDAALQVHIVLRHVPILE